MNKISALISSVILGIYFIYSIYIVQQELTSTLHIVSWGFLSLLGCYGCLTIFNNLNKSGGE